MRKIGDRSTQANADGDFLSLILHLIILRIIFAMCLSRTKYYSLSKKDEKGKFKRNDAPMGYHHLSGSFHISISHEIMSHELFDLQK